MGSTDLSGQQSVGGAQASAPTRDGFHFSIGLGTASVSATCTGCDVDFFGDRISGLSGYVQLGGAATSKLVIAAEFTGWMKNDVPIYRRIALLNLVLLGYPSETSGFFVKGGVGGLRAIAENDFVLVQSDAITATTGVGYDVPLGGKTKLTAYVNYIRTYNAETWINGFTTSVPVAPNAIQFGTALTLH
jgi:hypothetical protein